jgi:NADPH:quinone reductase-like Zn-dependent oxidoreductase
MKSYHINSGAGLDGLVMKEHDVPLPGPREVLVQVRASSLNFRELSILIRGSYPLPVRPDVVPVSDGAGLVAAVGESVTRVKVGDRVTSNIFPFWIDGPYTREISAQIGGWLDGTLAEYALWPEEGVVHVPDHLSFEEAAALPCAGVTAWNALTGSQRLQAGGTVLTLGSGGVSLFALQFAKISGARVIATTSSEEKAERLKALGADAVVNYQTTPDWHIAVREFTEGIGVDQVVEVGGPSTIERSIKSSKVGGEIALVGSLGASTSTNVDLYSTVWAGQVNLRSIATGSLAHFLAMNRAIAVNGLRPVIDRVFPFEEAKAAYRYYQETQPFGKVIISQN